MKIPLAFTFFAISLIMINCKDNANLENPLNKSTYTPIDQQELASGFQLLENNCFSCHSPNASMDSRIAPPMEAIKKHYIENGTSQEQFTEDLVAFMNEPNEDLSKIPGAVTRFGLMPKMNFSEEQITKIAAYIYNTELEKPEWFEKHYQEEHRKYSSTSQTSISDVNPLELGQTIAMKTKGVLGKNLLQAINTKGTGHALEFCSSKAIALMDSMAVSLNAKIKRVSDKNRNPNNRANDAELAYIKASKAALSEGKEILPQLTTIGDKQIGYYPIMTGQMCLQCHGGKGKEIAPSTLDKIEHLYPQDLATGYQVNQLRGIWVVEMDKNKTEF